GYRPVACVETGRATIDPGRRDASRGSQIEGQDSDLLRVSGLVGPRSIEGDAMRRGAARSRGRNPARRVCRDRVGVMLPGGVGPVMVSGGQMR
ncbi:MAG: hypothetical protein ACYC6Y_27650, partial [Thermoguttaceae bacterium]